MGGVTRRSRGQPDHQTGEHDGRRGEAEPGAGSLAEMLRYERSVDAGTDGTGEDDDVACELGARHLTITVPSMSWLWSVQT